MSGHSKWSQIKHKKALTDAKRGKIFSKLARLITVAAREKGGNPETNPQLRLVVEKARSFNLPQDNIERAIKRGTDEIAGAKIEELVLEAYGPGGLALLIEGASDNKNRALGEIKNILAQHEGKLAQPGSVRWLFERRGAIRVQKSQNTQSKEEAELAAIDAGAEDLKWLDKENLEIYTKPEDLEKIKRALSEKNITLAESSLGWVAKNEIALSDPKTREQLEKLFEALDENEEVNEIYSNFKA